MPAVRADDSGEHERDYRRTMKQASVFSADLSGVKRRGAARA
jgi:hypothetical protein